MSGKGIAIQILLPDDLKIDTEHFRAILRDFVAELSAETGRSVGIGVGVQKPNLNVIRRLR